MSAPRIWGAQVATASSCDSDYCPGPTRQASGVTLMNTPTARRARKRGRRSSVWQNWTPKRRLGSEQKKGPSTKCRVCASGKRHTKTSSGGGLIWKGDCAPARCHPRLKVTLRNRPGTTVCQVVDQSKRGYKIAVFREVTFKRG